MCGIVGLLSKSANGFLSSHADMFTWMLRMDTIRGDDSTGVFGVDKDANIDLIKADTDAWKFTSCKNYIDFTTRMFQSYRLVVGHNRAATKGTVSAANAHPFKEEHIVLVHNGTIYNQEDLDKSVEVDSHAIAKTLARKEAKEALQLINGPFALVWFDKQQKTLNLARNNERPLFVMEYDDYYCIVSEPGLPFWLNGRDNIKLVGKVLPVPIEKILQFNLENLKDGYHEVAFENYSKPYVSSYDSWYKPKSHLHSVSKPTSSANTINFKQGDSIVFKINDTKDDGPGSKITIFGSPLLGEELDDNILVKTEVTSRQEAETLSSTGWINGTIASVSTMGGIIVVFVRWASAMYLDKNENKSTDIEIKKAIAQGCSRCKGEMNFLEVTDSIIMARKDGTYRT